MTRSTANVIVTITIVGIGIAVSALGVAGVINISAARILLVVAWIVCIAGVCTAEAFAAKPLRQMFLVASVTAVVSGVPLLVLDRWIVAKRTAQETRNESPPTTIAQSEVDIATEIALSRKQERIGTEGGWPLKQLKHVKSGRRCENPPPEAVLNYWPLTFSHEAEFCSDFPIIDIRNANANGQYSQSMQDWLDGITAHNGDELYVLVYINNGAANVGVSLDSVLAKNVAITTQTDLASGNVHYVQVRATGANVETVYGKFRINTGTNERLEIIPKSGEVRDATGNRLLAQGFEMGNNTLKIGDLRPNFEDCLFIRYRVKVSS